MNTLEIVIPAIAVIALLFSLSNALFVKKAE